MKRFLAAIRRAFAWSKVRALETRLQYLNDRLTVEEDYCARADIVKARVYTKLKLDRARDNYLAIAEAA